MTIEKLGVIAGLVCVASVLAVGCVICLAGRAFDAVRR